MFMKNVRIAQRPFYEEAARRCGIVAGFGKPAIKAGEDPTSYVDYNSMHVPKWLIQKAQIAFLAIADAVIAEGPNFKTSSPMHPNTHILAAYADACAAAYDPHDEKDLLAPSVWHRYFSQGLDPQEAVMEQEKLEMADA